VAHLALKHRQNKHQRMRIVLFIGSPVEAETSELVSVGKKLRKCNVAVDVVSFGDVDENAEKLEAFMGAVNKNNNSNLVTVPPGANLADVLLSTPIFMDEDSGGGSGFAAAAAAASSHAAMQGFDGGDMMDGGDDPALMLALRVSLEEERARQEAAAAAANGGDAEGDAAAAPAEAEAKTAAAEAPAAGAASEDVSMMDEDALLQRAFALSMGGEGGDAVMDGGEDDPALQAALAMSMQEDQAGGAGAADPLADANYVNSILSSLPGVDPNDPSIQQALQGDAEKKEDEGEEEK
jgi:26S proteasome regulatory subunit N10